MTDSINSDYINANYYKKYCKQYILTQGPLNYYSCLEHFWLMVWDHCDTNNSAIIINLSKEYEENKIKYDNYFPTEHDTLIIVILKISLQSSEYILNNDIIKRIFILQNNDYFESKNIIHYHYVNWPDHGVQ